MSDPQVSRPDGRLAHRLQDAVLRGVLWCLLRLPYRARLALMGRLMARVVGPLTGYLRRADDNLARIYPRMPAERRRAIAREVCDNFGRTLIENYSHVEFGARLAQTDPVGPGVAALDAALAQGQAVIFVTGHFGNFEAPRHVLTRRGARIGGLYRPMANPFTDAHYRQTMTSWGGPVFAQGARGTMGFARHLKGGGLGTLLFDVMVHEGVPLPFLGQDAMTSLSAAELAVRFDALMIPYFGIRQPDGVSFRIEVDAPIPHGPPDRMMRAATARLESRIEAHPEQWFWVHRRWKPAAA